MTAELLLLFDTGGLLPPASLPEMDWAIEPAPILLRRNGFELGIVSVMESLGHGRGCLAAWWREESWSSLGGKSEAPTPAVTGSRHDGSCSPESDPHDSLNNDDAGNEGQDDIEMGV